MREEINICISLHYKKVRVAINPKKVWMELSLMTFFVWLWESCSYFKKVQQFAKSSLNGSMHTCTRKKWFLLMDNHSLSSSKKGRAINRIKNIFRPHRWSLSSSHCFRLYSFFPSWWTCRAKHMMLRFSNTTVWKERRCGKVDRISCHTLNVTHATRLSSQKNEKWATR